MRKEGGISWKRERDGGMGDKDGMEENDGEGEGGIRTERENEREGEGGRGRRGRKGNVEEEGGK